MESDEYDHIGNLGEGAFGKVYLVQSREDGKQYAMKVIDFRKIRKDDKDLALKEAEVLSHLSHPHILAFLKSFEDDGDFCIVTEYCCGGDLAQYLEKQNKEKLSEVLLKEWFREMAMALKYLHGLPIIHRDVKAPNIFLTDKLEVKLGDMGLAKVLQQPSAKVITMCGSPYYMSPEIFSCKPYDMKSDIWALAVIVYEMATLERPFDAKEMQQLVQKIVHEQLPVMPVGYDDDLVDLLTEMMQKDPDNRPSAEEILDHSYFYGERPTDLLSLVPGRGPKKGKVVYKRGRGEKNSKIDSLLSTFSKKMKEGLEKEEKSVKSDLEGTIRGDTLHGFQNILTHSFRNSDVKKTTKKSFKKDMKIKWNKQEPVVEEAPEPQISSDIEMSSTSAPDHEESGYNSKPSSMREAACSSDLDDTLSAIDPIQIRSSDAYRSPDVDTYKQQPGQQAGPITPDDTKPGNRLQTVDAGVKNTQPADVAASSRRALDSGIPRPKVSDKQPGTRRQAARESNTAQPVPQDAMAATTRRALNFSEPLKIVRERTEADALRVSMVVDVLTQTSPRDRQKLPDESEDKKRIVIQIEHLQQYIIKVLDDDMGMFNYIKNMLAETKNDKEMESNIVGVIGQEKYEQIQVQLVYWRNFEFNLAKL